MDIITIEWQLHVRGLYIDCRCYVIYYIYIYLNVVEATTALQVSL